MSQFAYNPKKGDGPAKLGRVVLDIAGQEITVSPYDWPTAMDAALEFQSAFMNRQRSIHDWVQEAVHGLTTKINDAIEEGDFSLKFSWPVNQKIRQEAGDYLRKIARSEGYKIKDSNWTINPESEDRDRGFVFNLYLSWEHHRPPLAGDRK